MDQPRDDHGRFSSTGGIGAWAARKTGPRPSAGRVIAESKKSLSVPGFQEALAKGVLKGSLSDHARIAQDFLAKHQAGLAKEVEQIKKLVPEGAKVKARTKDVESTLGKLVRKPDHYQRADQIQDGTGMRVIVKDIPQVKAVVDGLKKSYKVIEEKNYIDHPQKDTGYRSHHLIIQGTDGLAKEIQVRTENQNRHADWYHSAYKPHTPDQAEALKTSAPEINKYAEAVSNHFFAKDSGKSEVPPKPDCPPVVAKNFGCI